MIFMGVLVNAAAIAVGGVAGSFLKKGIPERLNTILMQGLALCTLYIGVTGLMSGNNPVIVILSIVAGAALGTWIDFDGKLNRLGNALKKRIAPKESDSRFADGFIDATLIVCVGGMAVVGSLQSGLAGNHETLFTKAIIDGVLLIVMGSAYGLGVCFSAVVVLVYEGCIVLLAQVISGLFTTAVTQEMTCVGSLLVIAIALNMLKITNIKTANLLLAPFLPILFYLFIG